MAPEGMREITVRVPEDVYDRLKRLFHGKGPYKFGKTTFRRYVASLLDHASFRAEADLEEHDTT